MSDKEGSIGPSFQVLQHLAGELVDLFDDSHVSGLKGLSLQEASMGESEALCLKRPKEQQQRSEGP